MFTSGEILRDEACLNLSCSPALLEGSSSSSSSSRFIDLIRSSDKIHIDILSKTKTPNPSHYYPSIIWLAFSFIIKRGKFYLYSTLFTLNTDNKIVVY